MGERIIKPWAERLQLQGVKFRTGRRVTQIAANADGLPGRCGYAAFPTLDSEPPSLTTFEGAGYGAVLLGCFAVHALNFSFLCVSSPIGIRSGNASEDYSSQHWASCSGYVTSAACRAICRRCLLRPACCEMHEFA